MRAGTRRVEAIVYDVDGTLLNTFEHIVRAFEIVLPQFGVEKDRKDIQAVVGRTLKECYAHFLGEERHEEAANLHHETQQTSEMYQLISAYEGLRETIDYFRSKGVRQAIATNRSRESLDLIFAHTGLSDSFEATISSGDIPNPKPNPEGVLLISERLNISPESMIMIEDTEIDILTAKNAKMLASVGVTHGFGTRESLEGAGTDFIIDSLTELPKVVAKIEEAA